MKVLILSESIAGSGHTKAANNIAKGIQSINPSAIVKVDTTLDKISPKLASWTSKVYMGTISHLSPLWGWAYSREKQWSKLSKTFLRKFAAKRLEAYIINEQPDIVIGTHAFCLGGLAQLKTKNNHSFLLGAVFTDYTINEFWLHDEIDHYFVGTNELQERLITHYKIPDYQIHVTGIPIDPKFSVYVERANFRRGHAIPNNIPLVLLSGGGLGLGAYDEILQALREYKQRLYLVVFTGMNPHSKQALSKYQDNYPHEVLLLDYVDNMHEWMKSADLLIGKPGGLTVSEAMASRLPLLIYKPIPGQEEKNSQFLLEANVAMQAKNKEELRSQVELFFSDGSLAQSIQNTLSRIGKPTAAMDVGRTMVSCLDNWN
jgi:processive 1,2-diacylglycerol beta-glucosyltransferase